MSFYPKLDPVTIKSLGLVVKLMAEQPDYLENEECPYGEETSEFLRSLGRKGPAPVKPVTPSTELDLLSEILIAYKELTESKPLNVDAAALQAYHRTRAALLTKLIELKDRSMNQKAMGDFYSKVLEILEEICTPTQRTIFADKLKDFAQ